MRFIILALVGLGLSFLGEARLLAKRSALEKRSDLGVSMTGMALPDLFNTTIDELQSGLVSGAFNSMDLVKAYLLRIAEVNPILNALIETNPEAIMDAEMLDMQRANGTVLGPLHGIPIIVKDNIATYKLNASSMNTTAGSFALLGSTPPSDSTIAAKLRKAGAIILGKSNLSQWANYRSTNSSNGWTSRGGQTYGAYYSMQDPSGSSSGSGVSSSIGLALAALGSETSGSIIGPSSRNCLAGIKPSVGLTSRYLVIPISQTQDTVGPMARTVKDAAYILSAIAGIDPNDNYTSAIPFPNGTIPDYAAACTMDALSGAKIGIPRTFITTTAANYPEIVAFNASLSTFDGLGANIIENANFPDLKTYQGGTNTSIVTGVDFVFDIANYFNSLTYNPTNITNIQQLIEFTHNDPREDWPDRNTVTWETDAALNLTQNSTTYTKSLFNDLYLGSNATILGAIDGFGLDAIIMPSSLAPGVAAIAGYPIVTVPLGFYPSNTTAVKNSRGTLVTAGPHFPFGLAFLGPRFSEEKLVAYAYAFEQATMVIFRPL